MSIVSDKLEEHANSLFENLGIWENNALQRIGKRIKAYGKMSIDDIMTINNAANVKQDFNTIIRELSQITKINILQIEEIYAEALKQQHLQNQPLYDYRNIEFVPFERNTALQAIVKAYARTTANTFINLSSTKMLCTVKYNGQVVMLQDEIYSILDKAVMSVASGTSDFYSAMRDSIAELGTGGIRVNYGSGITRRLDTVVRQNLLWGAKQASVEYNEMIGEELGCDGIEIDWHSNPRPSHEFMQGKQYVLGESRVINGKKFESADKALERLQDYGCLHFKTPIICGISEPTYTDDELKRLNLKNAQKYNIYGQDMTGYEVTQKMRALESSIREQKDIKTIAKASGDNVLVNKTNAKIKQLMEKYENISKIPGIDMDKKRLSQIGIRTKINK